MPPVSSAQNRAMHAAASGHSTLGIPVSVAREFIGDGPPTKKATHRGRKPSGKPGASHLAALQKAHGAGNYGEAGTHALNYANAAKAHAKGVGVPPTDAMGQAGNAGADVDDSGADSMGLATTTPPTIGQPTASRPPNPANQPNARAMLAKLAMTRGKK